MKSVDRIDINKKRAVPPAVKLILMLTVIMGLLLHTCWEKNKGDNFQISDIQLTNITRVSLDISFTVASRANIELEKSFMIEIYTNTGELLASKLTQLTLPPKTRKRYIKVLQKFNMPLESPDDIGDFRIYVYK